MEQTSATEPCSITNKIADRIEENLPYIAAVETVDNGKTIRENYGSRFTFGSRPF